MFGQAPETQYDLRFYVFGIFTRVHPLFWVVSMIMGWPRNPGWVEATGLNPLMIAVLWSLCVFISILVHELGHALTIRYFGWPTQIVLYYMGGYAEYLPTFGDSAKRSITISLNGPNAGFLLYGLVEAIWYFVPTATLVRYPALQLTLINMIHINLWWGLINLLPVFPLDGGRVCREVCLLLSRRSGNETSLKISIATGACVALLALSQQQTYIGIMFAVLAYYSFQNLQQHQRGPW
ncbi:MAG: site-2 protease family protein [Planctomycetota bacterium]|nr:site-2 protease family protein [Planctomycetota bacterium]